MTVLYFFFPSQELNGKQTLFLSC